MDFSNDNEWETIDKYTHTNMKYERDINSTEPNSKSHATSLGFWSETPRVWCKGVIKNNVVDAEVHMKMLRLW